jgi:RNA polymerase sigma factor (sigma-70 family)
MTTLETRTDEELMALYQHGNDAALAILHDRRQHILFAYIRNILRAHAPSLLDAADDIRQEVFARIHDHRSDFIAGTAVMAWLFKTAERLTRNHVKHECRQRRDQRRTRPLIEEWNPGASNEGPEADNNLPRKALIRRTPNWLAQEKLDPAQQCEMAEMVERCLGVLSPSDQEIVKLRYFACCTSQEIADLLHLPKTTVDWHIRESLARMREIAAA